MFEKNKLKEAKYFYSIMIKERDNREIFCYNLSAFLSASRSVLQYVLEEAKNKKNGQKWYDNYIFNNSIFSFFKDKRNINIHTEPISPIKNVRLGFRGTLHLSGSLRISHRDKNGNILEERTIKKPKKNFEKTIKQIEKSFVYKFSNWPDDEDVETLCKIYLDDLEKFINEGIKKGFITG